MRLFILFVCILTATMASAQKFFLFIGTYTGKGSKGIYVYRFDAKTGTAEWVSNTEGDVVNPSYLTPSADGKFLYAVNETNGKQPGGVSAFSFNRATGHLTLLNKQLSGGDDPCYITTDKSGKWVVVGNYSGGNFSAFPVEKNGALKPYAQLIQQSGTGINKERQEKAHVHATVFSPDGQYLFTPNLGTDKLMAYRFTANAAKPLQPATPEYAETEAGSGPRHLVFHPNKKWAYLIEELSGTVVAYHYAAGKLDAVQRLSTHPKDYKDAIGSADIHLSPDGKFLYASNRGDANSIAIFSVGNDGKLTWVGYTTVMGTTPRNFAIDPTGNYLLVANQASNNIVIFKRDMKTGLLQYTGHQIEIPNPVCLKMMK